MYNIEGARWILKHAMPVYGKNILEFGNQHIWKPAAAQVFNAPRCEIARDWFTAQGAFYKSIDMNGEDRASKLDLSVDLSCDEAGVPLDFFDIVTNIGTSEHCGDETQQQWNVFRNAFIFAKEGGLILHQLVPENHWQDHCTIWYKNQIASVLCEYMQCQMIECSRLQLKTLNPNEEYLCVALRKTGQEAIEHYPPEFEGVLVR